LFVSFESKKTLYTVLTALRRLLWCTSIPGSVLRTTAMSALTTWRATGGGEVSEYESVIV
jgi:hypothetical protein